MNLSTSTRSISPAQFAGLELPAQLDLLRGADARRKSRLILSTDNSAALMAALPAQEVYLMLKELGPEQLPELAALASGEQWTGFIDLDGWTGDRFSPDGAREWVAVLLMAEDTEVVAKLKSINFETLVLLVKHEVEVLAAPGDEDDEDARFEAAHHDGGYQLAFRDEVGSTLFGSLLRILLHNDPGFYRYLLEMVRAETFSLIEESVYQQRGLRLMDMGFPEPDSARAVYAWTDPDTFLAKQSPKLGIGLVDQGVAPGFPLVLSSPCGLLAAVLRAGIDEGTAWELATLVNRVAMADGIAMKDVEQVRSVTQKVNDTLNLALEWLTGKDQAAGAKLLSECYAQDLFRLGFSLTLRLQRQASRLLQSSIGRYLDQPYHACLTTLGQLPPRFPVVLEDPFSEATRSFARVAELQQATACLDQVEVQRRLVDEHLAAILPPAETSAWAETLAERSEQPSLSQLFLTALANRLLGRAFASVPLAADELVTLHGMVCRAGEVKSELRQETRRWLDDLTPGGGTFADFCLDIWAEGFCAVRAEALDPRFIEGLLVSNTP